MIRDSITLGIRIVSFAMSLGILGAFLLPWVKLDGIPDAVSGVGIISLIASPTGKYLYLISPVETVILIGAPIVILLAGLWLTSKYAQRRPAKVATVIVLACAGVLPYTLSNLLGTPNRQTGLELVVVFAAILLVQQVLIALATVLSERRKLPHLHRVLRVVTGSGAYRWGET